MAHAQPHLGRRLSMSLQAISGCLRNAFVLAVAYAFVLQTCLAYSFAGHGATQSSAAGSLFVICSTHGEAADEDAPADTITHCPLCTLTTFGLTVTPASLALPFLGTLATAFVSIEACLAFHRARAGLSRAPPRQA